MWNSIPSPLLRHALDSPRAPAIINDESELSWSGLKQQAGRVKGWLIRQGYKAGDRIALAPTGRVEEICFLWGCLEAGVIFCGINARWPFQQRTALAQAVDADFLTPDAIIAANKQAPALDRLDSWDLSQPATIIFTSGTTGHPKAALLRLGNHYYNALGSNQNIEIVPADRWLFSLPLYHVSGLGIVFRTLLGGAAVVISDELLSVESLKNNRITHLSLVDAQFQRLLRDPNISRLGGKLKAILLGGGPIQPDLVRRARELELPIFVSYGLSEMGSQVATSLPNQSDLSSAGILPYRQVKIGKNSEVLVKGETLFTGYLSGAAVDPARDDDGWFHTRDVGTLKGTQLRIVGRLDNQFISGGENIQPELIERKLQNMPGIEMAIVVPVADAAFGQRPFAFVKTNRNHTDFSLLRDLLKQELPDYMLPVAVSHLPEHFMLSLKPDRRALAKLASTLR